MMTQQSETLDVERPEPECLLAEAGIVRDVLTRLGRPRELHRVQVKPVFGGKYRVNVYVRADAATYRVAHSYFLEADAQGKVLACSPAITLTY